MDFNDSPTEAAFRAEARAFLEAHAPRRPVGARAEQSTNRRDSLAQARAWQRVLYENGWAAMLWPKTYGGRGLGPIEQVVWNQECERFGIGESIFVAGIGMAGPTIITHGTEEQKSRHLPPMLAGELLWCQLFSEPGAGSDLAAVRTRAVQDGDTWVVTGQKVWSSFADFADWGFMVVRTDPKVPKRDGLSYFLVDMKSPGITIRPLQDITGGAHFNEVFFDEVRVPDTNRVGRPGEGWNVTRTTLLHERMAIGSVSRLFSFEDLAAFARAHPERLDPITRDRLAKIYAWSRSLDLLNTRVMTKLGRGEDPTAEASVTKLAVARILTMAGELGMHLQGESSLMATGTWQHQFLFSPAMHIAGGTDEIQKNVVAERVLGLPREPDPLADCPFEDLPHS
jgi:alkylation response protein AidB-like acyl-CoA dehydrogenase